MKAKKLNKKNNLSFAVSMHCVPLFTVIGRLKPILLFSASILAREKGGENRGAKKIKANCKSQVGQWCFLLTHTGETERQTWL